MPPTSARLSRGLIAVNAALVLGLGLAALAPSAIAGRQPTRARGVYTMVNGAIQGGNSDAIYIVDSANQEMVVIRWNDGRTSLEGIGYRNLTGDAQAQPGR
jgi:hypothetical protein